MAAGSGSRYGSLKQFDELGPNQEFLMEFSIYDSILFGFDHVVVITKEANKEFLKEYLTERLPDSIKIDVVVQDINDLPSNITLNNSREKPWGTAHAVWSARHVIKSDFVIINADDYYGKKAYQGAANFIKTNISKSTYALVVYKLKDTLSDFGSVSRGVCSVINKKLAYIEEHTKIKSNSDIIKDLDSGRILTPDTLVSMNFWICNPSIFNFIENYFVNFLQNPNNLEKSEIYLPFVAQEMMSGGLIDITVIESNSDWFGITYYDDKVKAESTLADLAQSGQYPSPLWN